LLSALCEKQRPPLITPTHPFRLGKESVFLAEQPALSSEIRQNIKDRNRGRTAWVVVTSDKPAPQPFKLIVAFARLPIWGNGCQSS
jgi:hypothetical protein